VEHEFTLKIRQILAQHYGAAAAEIFEASPLVQYVNIKTKSASRGSKARSSFANLYAVYVLVEDYVTKGFHQKRGYADYEGAVFTDLFKRQRGLPFGQKLQNHALNHRMNEEFRRSFPTSDYIPILRDLQTNRYWFNENLLRVRVGRQTYQLAQAVLQIIEATSPLRKMLSRNCSSFVRTRKTCRRRHKWILFAA
jgi:hypothetical protein